MIPKLPFRRSLSFLAFATLIVATAAAAQGTPSTASDAPKERQEQGGGDVGQALIVLDSGTEHRFEFPRRDFRFEVLRGARCRGCDGSRRRFAFARRVEQGGVDRIDMNIDVVGGSNSFALGVGHYPIRARCRVSFADGTEDQLRGDVQITDEQDYLAVTITTTNSSLQRLVLRVPKV